MVHFTQTGTVFTVPKQSKWAVRGQLTHPTSVLLCGTKFPSHFRPHTYQNTIYCINHDTNTQFSPYTATDCPNGFQKFSHFGPKFWVRSNGRSRPQTNPIINKTLKQSVTSSRIKPLHHGVCQNSKKSVPTCYPRCIERLCFLARRNPTVRSSGIL